MFIRCWSFFFEKKFSKYKLTARVDESENLGMYNFSIKRCPVFIEMAMFQKNTIF